VCNIKQTKVSRKCQNRKFNQTLYCSLWNERDNREM